MALRLSRLNQAMAACEAASEGLGAAEEGAPPLSKRAVKTSLVMLLADINRLDQELSAGFVHPLS